MHRTHTDSSLASFHLVIFFCMNNTNSACGGSILLYHFMLKWRLFSLSKSGARVQFHPIVFLGQGHPPVRLGLPQQGACLLNQGSCLPQQGSCLPNQGSCLPRQGSCLPNQGSCLPLRGIEPPFGVFDLSLNLTRRIGMDFDSCWWGGSSVAPDCLF